MTTTHTNPDSTAEPVTGSESSTEGSSTAPDAVGTGEPDNGSTPEHKGREERFRKERNAAISERDALAQRIEQMNRREVERIASEHLAVGADLFLNDNDVAAYLTESGEIDADRVREDAKLLLTERPRLGKPVRGFDPTQGYGRDATRPKKKLTWSDALSAK